MIEPPQTPPRRLLLAGHGDIARRLEALLPGGVETFRASRASGFDFDRPETLAGLAARVGAQTAVLHSAPPQNAGVTDTRTANLLAALDQGPILPSRLVYIGTSGVYGDCAGALVDETRAVQPQTERAQRRADAERQLLAWGAARGVPVVVLRAPGIYAADRLPLARLAQGTPVLADQDDVYTNHIHAEDLARICLAALADAAPAGIYNASDDSEIRMGAWFDLVAERHGLPRPPRIRRAEAQARIPAALLSFMGESRRLLNAKMKRELGVQLLYPTVYQGVPATVAKGGAA